MGNKTSGFDSTVWDAVTDITQLRRALATHGHLIDVPHPETFGRRPLHHAAIAGQAAAIELLVQAGSQTIDTPDQAGWTPLFHAAANGHATIIEVLIRLGSRAVDIPNKNNWTPMQIAASRGHVAVLATLVRFGSRMLDHPDLNGWTPLFTATVNQQPAAIEELVRLGSQALDHPNAAHRTPLHIAEETRCKQVLKALGASCCVNGRTAPFYLDSKLSAEQVIELRYRVYFARSLMDRLLCSLD